MAAPIPRLAPVTTATCPERGREFFCGSLMPMPALTHNLENQPQANA
jgi:hypothetical protein